MEHDIAKLERDIRNLILEYVDCPFRWSTATKAFGCCRWKNGKLLDIRISMPLAKLNSWEVIRRTVLHEVAHALVGPGHGHDKAWKAQARALGISDERCYNNARDGVDVITVPKKFRMVCLKCGKDMGETNKRYSRYATHKNCGGRILYEFNRLPDPNLRQADFFSLCED